MLQCNCLLLILIVVGVWLDQFECWFGVLLIVCCMFNMLVLIGVGVIGLCVNVWVSLLQCVQVQYIFDVVGFICWVDDEVLMDMVIGIFGFVLVYFFVLVEVLEDVVVVQGMDCGIVCVLVVQICLGVGCMLVESGEVFGELCCCVILFNGIIQVVLESFVVDGLFVIVVYVVVVVICCGGELVIELDKI